MGLFNKDGKKDFVLAVDHPSTMPSPLLSDIDRIMDEALEGGVDAFLASYGCVRHFRARWPQRDARFILRADGGVTSLDKPAGEPQLLFGADDAARVGAGAMLCMGFPGASAGSETLVNVARNSAAAHGAGLLSGAEMLPYGFAHPEGIDTRSVENVAFACRIGAELGADFIKTEFTGGERFREVVRGCWAPIMVLGGSKTKEEKQLLEEISRALDCGAAGIIMGRNIVRSGCVRAMCHRISAIVHEGKSVDEALSIKE